MSAWEEYLKSSNVPSMVCQIVYHTFTTVVRFCFWSGILYCACKWVPIAVRIAAGN